MISQVRELIHEQTTPSAAWVITHNFGYNPTVSVTTEHNGTIQTILPASIVHGSDNQLTIHFSSDRTGTARCV